MAQRIRLSALPDAAEAVPGGRLDLVLTLGNDGSVVDRYLLSVGGVPADWYDLDTPAVALFPGASAQVALALHPPADADAGSYRLVITAVAEDDPSVRTSVPIALVVSQVGAVSMGVLPPAAQGRTGAFRVTFQNSANAAATMLLVARDDQEGLRFYSDPSGPLVAPARGEASVMVRVIPRSRKLIGAAHPYQVEFRSVAVDEEEERVNPFLRRDGVLVRHARYTYLPRFNALLLPRWVRKIPALVPLVLLLLLLAATAAVANRPPVKIAKPPVFRTFTPIPTPTPRPTFTPYPTPTARPTYTPMPSPTARSTYTRVPTATPRPTVRPTATSAPLPAIRINDFGVQLGTHRSVQLVWAVSRARTVRLNGHDVRAAGSRLLRLTTPATFILSATRGRETVVRIIRVAPRSATLVVPSLVASLPVIQQFGTRADAASGATSLVWAVHGADTVTLNGVRVANTATLPITPTAGVTYQLRAVNALGAVTASVVIVVSPPSTPGERVVLHLPAISRFALVNLGGGHGYALAWQTRWATMLTLDGRRRALSGRLALAAPLHSHTYQLVAQNGYGSAHAAVRIVAAGSAGGVQVVVVSAPRIVSFAVSMVQGRLMVAWRVLDAVHVWLDGRPVPSVGERHVPLNAALVRLEAGNDAGTVQRVVRIERVQPPTPTITNTPPPTATSSPSPTSPSTPIATTTARPTTTGSPAPSPTGTPQSLIIPALPTLAPSSTSTPTATATLSPTATPSPTPAPTATPTPSPTAVPSATATAAPPPLSISPATLAWGGTFATAPLTVTVSVAGSVARTITAVTIGGANPSGFAITANSCAGARLTSGASCTVTVAPVADSALAASCALTGTLTFADDARDTLPVVSLTSYQQPGACFVPPAVSSTLTFGVQGVGTSSTQPLTITNVGSAPMQIGSIVISGTSASDFTEQDNCVGATIAAGASCTAQVTFAPDLHADGVINSGEQMQATLTIGGVTYPASGTSVASTSVALQGTAGLPAVGFYPTFSTLNFAAVRAGQSGAPNPVWLVNEGPGLLQVSSVSTDGPDFTVNDEQCSGQPLAVYGSCKIDVSFTPPITASAGNAFENLVVATNGAANHSYLALDGYVEPANSVSAIPDTLDFVSPCGAYYVSPAPCQQRTVIVSSTETQPVSVTNVAAASATPNAITVDASACTAQLVPPNGSCSINVSLGSGAQFGPSGTSQLTINDTVGSGGTPQTQNVALRWSPLLVTSQDIDLGSAPVGGVVTQTVTITNEDSVTDTFQSLSTGGAGSDNDFTAGFGTCTGLLGPGQSCNLIVGFQPTTTGPHHTIVQLADTDASVPIELLLNGTATAPTPSLFIYPASLTWNQSPSVQTVTVANIGSAPRTVTSVTLGQGSTSSFTIASNTCTGATLAPNTACTIAVGIAPTASPNGFFSDTLNITDNMGDALLGVSLQYNGPDG